MTQYHYYLLALYFQAIVYLGFENLYAQNDPTLAVDSLDTLLQKAEKESSVKHGWILALKYYGEAYRLAQKEGVLEEQALALRGIAKIESSFGNRTTEALRYLQQELAIRARIDAPFETAQSYLLIGELYENKLLLPQNAMGYYLQALHLQEKFNDTAQNRLLTLDKIIGIYRYLNQHDSLIRSERKKLSLLQSVSAPKKELAQTLRSISEAYLALNQLEEALNYAIDAQEYLPQDDTELATYLESLEEKWKEEQETPDRYTNFFWWGLVIFSILMSLLAIRQRVLSLRKSQKVK